jgi:hypothetical protein
MSIGLAFWIIYLICVLFGLWTSWPAGGGNLRPLGFPLVIFILIAFLGWRVFGPALHS